jgi:hypothetical protein
MLLRHKIATGRTAEMAVTEDCSPQTTTAFFPKSRWAGESAEKRKVEQAQGSNPAPNNADGSRWETIALWIFIAGIFIISVLAGYLFWLKLSLGSP